MRFVLKCIHSEYDNYTGEVIGDGDVITHEFRADELYEVLEKLEDFLRGSGFHFKGHLEPIEEIFTDDSIDDEDNMDEEWTFNIYKKWEEDHPEICPVCKIDTNTMKNHECFDKNCPKAN